MTPLNDKGRIFFFVLGDLVRRIGEVTFDLGVRDLGVLDDAVYVGFGEFGRRFGEFDNA